MKLKSMVVAGFGEEEEVVVGAEAELEPEPGLIIPSTPQSCFPIPQ